jgi:hypothetical protein
MAYLSKAQRARDQWITLKEAVEHIKRVEKIDENIALQQLRLALADGAVGASWSMDKNLPEEPGDSPACGFEIAACPDPFWFIAIDMEVGTIDFQHKYENPSHAYIARHAKKRPRPSCDTIVWVWKESILKYWPEDSDGTKSARKPDATPDDYREALREEYKMFKREGRKIPNVNQTDIAYRLPNKRVLAKAVAAIAMEKEFKDQRLRAGQRPPKRK